MWLLFACLYAFYPFLFSFLFAVFFRFFFRTNQDLMKTLNWGILWFKFFIIINEIIFIHTRKLYIICNWEKKVYIKAENSFKFISFTNKSNKIIVFITKNICAISTMLFTWRFGHVSLLHRVYRWLKQIER